MHFYLYFFLFAWLIFIGLFIRFLLRQNNIPIKLFIEALKNENMGRFEAAEINYTTALNAVKKIRFHKDLKNKIIEKLKLMHTILEYQNGLGFNKKHD
jgi:hypothetical protein